VVTSRTTRLNIQQFHVLPTHCICVFLWISEQTAIISLYSINWLVFITETEYVYCAVRIEYLYVIQVNFRVLRAPYTVQQFSQHRVLRKLFDRVWCGLTVCANCLIVCGVIWLYAQKCSTIFKLVWILLRDNHVVQRFEVALFMTEWSYTSTSRMVRTASTGLSACKRGALYLSTCKRDPTKSMFLYYMHQNFKFFFVNIGLIIAFWGRNL
jgi:hypothetical protein